MKKCSVCGKEIETGYKCTECKVKARQEYGKKYYSANKERCKEIRRKWYEKLKENPEKYNALKEVHKQFQRKYSLKKRALNGRLEKQIESLTKKFNAATEKENLLKAKFEKSVQKRLNLSLRIDELKSVLSRFNNDVENNTSQN